MTPHDFLAKWRNVDLKERTASQSHFNDLCRLIGIEDPISADPRGEFFTFEKGASKTSGGEGWADVWRRDCFAWEYKGRAANLDKAYDQLLRYSIALDSPPLLIVSDMERIRIHTNWTNTVQQVTEIALEDLADAGKREILRACFENPEILRPSKTRQILTEEAASEFASLAQRLHNRGHPPQTVAHFVNRLVFCMFAEDVRLLPDKMFERMLKASRQKPADFVNLASSLFGAMRTGGMVGFERVEWFNGGLFDDDTALPLEIDDIDALIAAARLDWSEIDPSILGTLFERGLDPSKRSQLGAHYTDREKIMMIVKPVIIDPLEREWSAAKAIIAAALAKADAAKGAGRTKALVEAGRVMTDWRERLLRFRVLDPACGSGNFLYLALLSLKDIEHRANLEAEQMGLPREFPRVGPENVLGLELNPYAAELARVSVWIGEIQWMRRNGFDAARNPILRTLSNIECRDSVLATDQYGQPLLDAGGKPQRARWPEADVVVGNPPFLGNKKMIAELGETYTRALRKAWPQVPSGADLVCYWFSAAWDMMVAGKLERSGLVATNSIRGGTNRDVLQRIATKGCIFHALSDEPWTVDGAAVRVSLISFSRECHTPPSLDGAPVARISADLTADHEGIDLTLASKQSANQSTAFQGPVKVGPFDIDHDRAQNWLKAATNPNGRTNNDVVRPLLNGLDITRRPTNRWIVNFNDLTEVEASLYEKPFEYVREFVKPVRDANRDQQRRENWWRLGRSGRDLNESMKGLKRAIFSPRVAKHRLFVWAPATTVPDSAVVVIARDDNTTFGILHSRMHELWSLRMGSTLEDRPRYTPSTTFETFPFPEGLTPDIPAANYADDPRAQRIAHVAARLNELRDNWLNPENLVQREPEIVAGYPDRILPVNAAAAKELAKRTLTNLYNTRPAWLTHAHQAVDEAVADAYGWGDDWRAGSLTDDEILTRLFHLNQQRA